MINLEKLWETTFGQEKGRDLNSNQVNLLIGIMRAEAVDRQTAAIHKQTEAMILNAGAMKTQVKGMADAIEFLARMTCTD